MLTALTEFSDNGNSRTYTQSSHTALDNKLVIQKRKVPSGNQVVLEDRINVLTTTHNSDGAVLPQKVSFEVIVRRPIDGVAADVTEQLAVFRDIIAGDEFTNTVNTQEYLV